MHDYLKSLILGIIEGLTEFLPVSSTAHLRLTQHWMNIPADDEFWKAYAIVIQLGAVLCLPVYFWPRIKALVKSFPTGDQKDRNLFNHPLTLTLIAFVCTAIPAYLLKKKISANLENYHVMAIALLVGGVVMWGVDVLFKKPTTERMDQMSIPQAIWIGLLQTLAAIFPGTSRSMATIAAGQTAGLSRSAALEFSFFVSIPTMFAATGKELAELVLRKGEWADTNLVLGSTQWITLAIGFIVSFFVALIVVHLFMGWVRRRGFVPFAIYRILLGGFLLYWLTYKPAFLPEL